MKRILKCSIMLVAIVFVNVPSVCLAVEMKGATGGATGAATGGTSGSTRVTGSAAGGSGGSAFGLWNSSVVSWYDVGQWWQL